METTTHLGSSKRVDPPASIPGTHGVLRSTPPIGPQEEKSGPPQEGADGSTAKETSSGIYEAIRLLKDQSWAVTVLAVLAVLAAVYVSRAILFPIILATVLNLLLKPAILRLERWGIKPGVGALFVIIAMLCAVTFAGAFLWNPVTSWVANAPHAWHEITTKLEPLRDSIAQLNRASATIEALSDNAEGDAVKVTVQEPRVTGTILVSSTSFLASMVVVVALLYFLLADGDRFLEKVVFLMPTLSEKKNVVEMSRAIQKNISNYLVTISSINVVLGTAIGIAMWLLGLPNPMLWGVMACLLNFIPYAGATVGAITVFLVALLRFDPAYSLLAPLVYVIINSIEANLVTPSLLGRSMSLSPVIIFLMLAIWGWMWGIPGVLLAVPMLVIVKITCDHVERLAPIGRLLER